MVARTINSGTLKNRLVEAIGQTLGAPLNMGNSDVRDCVGEIIHDRMAVTMGFGSSLEPARKQDTLGTLIALTPNARADVTKDEIVATVDSVIEHNVRRLAEVKVEHAEKKWR